LSAHWITKLLYITGMLHSVYGNTHYTDWHTQIDIYKDTLYMGIKGRCAFSSYGALYLNLP